MAARIRTFLTQVAILTVSTMLSLLLLEVLVRVALPVYSPAGRITFIHRDGVPLAPPNFAGRMWKNTGDYDVAIRINKLGFRDQQDLAESTIVDWFVVGDSFSFGHGVEEADRFSNVLDAMLPVDVYNISIPTDLAGYRKLLSYAKVHGARVEHLIIGLCMENDVLDYECLRALRAEPKPAARGASPLRDLKRLLTTHSAVYNAMTTLIHRSDALKQLALRLGLVRSNEEALENKSVNRAQMESTLRELQTLATEHPTQDLVIVIIPSRTLWLGSHQAEESAAHADFVDLLRRAGFDLIDMKPILEKDKRPLDFHFKNDGHWNAAGHRSAAQAIYDRLENGRARPSVATP